MLDPFAGGGTTLVSALSLRRHAIGCELSAEFITLSLRRICSNLVHAQISIATLTISLDPQPRSEDRSKCVHSSLQLIQQECRFYFIGRIKREVIFSALAATIEDACQKFRAAGHPDSAALFIIKTETEIYLA